MWHLHKLILACNPVSHPSMQCWTSWPVNRHRAILFSLTVQLSSSSATLLQAQVGQLHATVAEQRRQIDRLTTRLDFVLSYLGVDVQQSDNVLTPTTSESRPTYAAKAASAPSHVVDASNQPRSSDRQFSAAVMSAVYADQSDKKRRESSVVVNGLQPTSDGSDTDAFCNLCVTQMGLSDVVISFCRRLGAATTGRVQSLLVVVQSADIAQELVIRAKLVRPIVNDNADSAVYINRNLTRAEAKASYEERCRRRQAADRRAARL